MKNKAIIYIFILALLSACEPNLSEDFEASKGTADFSTYVALGNSLTAGYADGALYRSAQENSFPAILANQFATAGGGEFRQPIINTEEGVGIQSTPLGPYFVTKRVLGLVEVTDCQGTPTGEMALQPVLANPAADQQTLQQYLFSPPPASGPYNNMGVPGALVQHLLFDQYGNPNAIAPNGMPLFNPYFVRFASSPDASVMDDAIAQDPTFFTLWIGGNDILSSALAGTDTLMTPPQVFEAVYGAIIQTLMGFRPDSPPKGVLANIPDILSIPYFTTISQSLPYNGLVLTQEQAIAMTGIYHAYGYTNIGFQAGPNPFIIQKSDGSLGPMQEGDIFLLSLPTKELQCAGLGSVNLADTSLNPIPDKYVLELSEQQNIRNSTEAYNTSIAAFASQNGLALLDVNTLMKEFETGMVFDGVTYSTTFVQGGLFSLDGVHLNGQGNAILANYFIEKINETYNANVPEVVVGNYPGIEFP